MEGSRWQPSSSNVQGLAGSSCKTHTKKTPSRHTAFETVMVVTDRGTFSVIEPLPFDRPTKKLCAQAWWEIGTSFIFLLSRLQTWSECGYRHSADFLSKSRRVTSHGSTVTRLFVKKGRAAIFCNVFCAKCLSGLDCSHSAQPFWSLDLN